MVWSQPGAVTAVGWCGKDSHVALQAWPRHSRRPRLSGTQSGSLCAPSLILLHCSLCKCRQLPQPDTGRSRYILPRPPPLRLSLPSPSSPGLYYTPTPGPPDPPQSLLWSSGWPILSPTRASLICYGSHSDPPTQGKAGTALVIPGQSREPGTQ